MGLFSMFGGKTNWKKTLIKDLVILSSLDGEIDELELKSLMESASELGVSKDECKYVFANMKSIPDEYPKDLDDKINYINALIQLTYSDGYVDEREVDYMKAISEKIGLDPVAIDRAIARLAIEEVARNITSQPRKQLVQSLTEQKMEDPEVYDKNWEITYPEFEHYLTIRLSLELVKKGINIMDERVDGFLVAKAKEITSLVKQNSF